MAKKNSSRKQILRNWLIISLVAWLGALPVIAAVQIIFGFVFSGIDTSETMIATLNTLSFLLGLYVVIGWIPVLVLLKKYQSKK